MASIRGHYLPLGQRIHLYDKVQQLRKRELTSSSELQRILYAALHVRVPLATIKDWVRGKHEPLGKVNRFDESPSPELAYILGVKVSDGWLCKRSKAYHFELAATDYEFTAETGRCVAKVLGLKRRYRPRWDKSKRCWLISPASILLYRFLEKQMEMLKPYIDHCGRCVAAFLRAFFDGEGSINKRVLKVDHTNFVLLHYVRYLLRRHFAIATTGPRRIRKKGQRFRSPRSGKTYERKKTYYRLYVRVHGLPLFYRYIGFTIKRKQRRLIEAIQK